MKRTIAIGIALALSTSQALAANSCPTPGGHTLSTAGITTLLAGNYACITGQNNELHSGGATGLILDYKKGPGDPSDPSDTAANPSGHYAIANNSITYSYPGATGSTYVYTYTIDDRIVSGNPPPMSGVHTFCQTSPGTTQFNVTVQPTHC